MLRLALGFELKRLQRSRASAFALLAFLAAGVLAIMAGQLKVVQWNSALEAGAAAQAESIAEARDYLSRGEPGPPDRAWVDLSQALWQDWYSGTRIGREPGGLAGIAAGAIDSAPVVFRISRMSDPMAVGGYRIENPELAGSTIDLVLVIGVLLPLLVGVLGLDIGSRERESRLDLLIAVQVGTTWRWLVARAQAISIISGVAAAILCIAAGLAGGAHAKEIVVLVFVSTVYAFLWGGLLLMINARARTVRGSAFAFGVLWSVFCVLLPTLSSEYALVRVESDFAVEQTLNARAIRYAAYEQDVEDILPALYERYPGLRNAPATADNPLDPTIARHAYDAMVFAGVEDRHRQRVKREQYSATLAERAAWLSPTVALSLIFERLAGVGPEAAAAYRNHLMESLSDRVAWVVARAWAKQPLGTDDFERLVGDQGQNFRTEPGALSGPVIALSIWTFMAWLLSQTGLKRSESRAISATS